jgi:hypothetical protein
MPRKLKLPTARPLLLKCRQVGTSDKVTSDANVFYFFVCDSNEKQMKISNFATNCLILNEFLRPFLIFAIILVKKSTQLYSVSNY